MRISFSCPFFSSAFASYLQGPDAPVARSWAMYLKEGLKVYLSERLEMYLNEARKSFKFAVQDPGEFPVLHIRPSSATKSEAVRMPSYMHGSAPGSERSGFWGAFSPHRHSHARSSRSSARRSCRSPEHFRICWVCVPGRAVAAPFDAVPWWRRPVSLDTLPAPRPSTACGHVGPRSRRGTARLARGGNRRLPCVRGARVHRPRTHVEAATGARAPGAGGYDGYGGGL
jgi:hypothetical protein